MSTDSKPCTLIVFGAGASVAPYTQEGLNMMKWRPIESDPDWFTASHDKQTLARKYKNLAKHMPPLTAGLVESLQEVDQGCSLLLNAVDDQIKTAIASNTPFDFENTLRRIYEASGSDLKEEFSGLRKALAARMQRADKIGEALPTLYTDLFTQFQYGENTKDRNFLAVNMNYDRLAEYALNNKVQFPLIRSYVDHQRQLNLVHPHGNSGWIANINSEPHRHQLVQDGQPGLHLEMNNSNAQTPYTPAIAIPMYGDPRGKMVWPTAHKEFLVERIPAVDHIIVIGWRGADDEVVDLVTPLLNRGSISSVHLVNRNEDGTTEMWNNLMDWLPDDRSVCKTIEGGFLAYIEDDDSPLYELYPKPNYL